MSSKWRRFEVLLPLQFNDGRDVPPEWLAEAVLEIVDHFGAAMTAPAMAAARTAAWTGRGTARGVGIGIGIDSPGA